jgi:ribosomal protein S18 acetylase RimI-like enzyme
MDICSWKYRNLSHGMSTLLSVYRVRVHSSIQQYLRSVVAAERKVVPAGSFVLYLHPRSEHPYLNYAIPVDGATGGDGAELVVAARERGLVPRLEFIEPCFPWVEAALAPAGFGVEARLRVLTCTQPRDSQSPAEIVVLERGSPLIRDAMTAQRAAFGEGPPSDDDVAASSGRLVAALVEGNVVGAASWTRVLDGTTEIAGVGVMEEFRRRGIAAALTAAATRAAFAEGATLAMLTPGDDDAGRVYERAGFEDTGTTMLHLRA